MKCLHCEAPANEWYDCQFKDCPHRSMAIKEKERLELQQETGKFIPVHQPDKYGNPSKEMIQMQKLKVLNLDTPNRSTMAS